jgi:fatty acid CoA ligase FadD9
VRKRLPEAVELHILDDITARGAALPPEAAYLGETADRLAMIFYTSGSTGTPKGVMYTEAMVTKLWTAPVESVETPVFNLNFMPLNHGGGRLPLSASFQTGGTSYFVAEPDLSTLFDDWALVRPTELPLVPRVVDMLFQRYRAIVDRLVADGVNPCTAETEAKAQVREQLLGGRVLGGWVGTAPLGDDMKVFLDSALDVHVADGYGTTETAIVTMDGVVRRPPVIDYKLVDVPELGYFGTDKPYPRGELLVLTAAATPGYYKRADSTAEVFDKDGYYRTGDVMAEVEPGRLSYVDRRNNVLKLSQGEFVAVAHLEAVFSGAPLVRQIFVYGNSERPALLAVIVPTPAALQQFNHIAALKTALSDSVRQTAKAAQLQSYEVPVDFLVETEPFTAANGLLGGVGKLLRPNLKRQYGERLEQMYADIAAAQVNEIRALRETVADRSVLDTVTRAAQLTLGSTEVDPDAHFTDLGGDSLSALTFSNVMQEFFGVEVPVGVIINPASDLVQLANFIETARGSAAHRPTFGSVHGEGARELDAADLKLAKFIDAKTLALAPSQPAATGEPTTVLLTGANGWLGRFLALEWLQRLSPRGGKLIVIVRGRNAEEARVRLEKVYDTGDPELLRQFRELAADHLEVVPGDMGEQMLGLSDAVWSRLAGQVDLVVHAAALVNHVLPYSQLFGPNVVGTAEVIRLAITTRVKPVTYLSTVAVTTGVAPGHFEEDGDIRLVNPIRRLDDTYANGYANTKWAGEVLLREAWDLCGMPGAVFRADMIMAHPRYVGQLNMPDMFTRLILSVIATGIAPQSFYQDTGRGGRARAHYDGLPVDFIAEAITTIGATVTKGFRSFDVMNPHDDGVSLDVIVDWLVRGGNKIERIADYDEWLARLKTALTGLPEKLRQQSVLPILDAYRKPETPICGAAAPTDAFRAAVREAKVGADKDIPRLWPELICKYIADLRRLGWV